MRRTASQEAERAAELAALRAENRRLAAALCAAEGRPIQRCVYCGNPTRSGRRVCAEHRDLIDQ